MKYDCSDETLLSALIRWSAIAGVTIALLGIAAIAHADHRITSFKVAA